MNITQINSQSDFDRYCDKANHSSRVAIDTEFMRDQTYYPQLCLLQLAVEDEIALVDPFGLDNFDAFKQLLDNPEVVKLFHSSQQDIELLQLEVGTIPRPLFDTQIAATFLGQKNQIGYADLVSELLNQKLDKSHTRTDWSRRPLSEQQLSYAANDVLYLLEIHTQQSALLQQNQRLSWFNDEITQYLDSCFKPIDPDQLWKKVKGHQSMRGVGLNILKHLAIWREQKAQTKNRPRRFILKDDILIDLVRLKPKSIQDIRKIRQFPRALDDAQLQELLNCVSTAKQEDKSLWPKLDRYIRLSKNQEAMADCMAAIVKQCAQEHGLSTEILATRKDIDAMLTNPGASKLSEGWRYELAGQTLEQFHQGKVSLCVDEETLQVKPKEPS